MERCIACWEPADHCQGGHGGPCESCDGYESAHDPLCVEVLHLPWVHVYTTESDDGTAEWLYDVDPETLVRYMAQWDYAEETDESGLYVPPTEEDDLKSGAWFYRDPNGVAYPWGSRAVPLHFLGYILVRGEEGGLSLYRHPVSS